MAGLSYRGIARELSVSLDTAWGDVQAELTALRAIAVKRAEEIRELELRRLDKWTISATKKMQAGSVPAGFLLVKLQERRAKLLGLDAPVANVHTGADGGPIQVARVLFGGRYKPGGDVK
jgi:hypothetical protein